MRQTRADMKQETRAKLITVARQAFAERGFAQSSMDELTAQAGLTRGALYHHFGDKKGLLEAVIAQIDAEMVTRLTAIVDSASDTWQGFIDENIAYIHMALEPEIQRIVFRDGPAVLGDPSGWPIQNACIQSTRRSIDKLVAEGVVQSVDALATARLIMGALLGASQWIANADDPQAASKQVIEAFVAMVSGLRTSALEAAPSTGRRAQPSRPQAATRRRAAS